MSTDLAHACAIVSRETTLYTIRRATDLAKFQSIQLFGFGAHTSNGEDLLVLLHTLLQLAKQDAEACNGSQPRPAQC